MLKTTGLLASLALLCLVGCSESGPPKFAVSGKVTFDGAAVDGAVITFVPASGPKTASLAIRSKEDGTFSTKAEAGNYKIRVSKIDALDGGMGPGSTPPPPAANKKMTEEEELAAIEAAYGDDQAKPQGKEQKAKNHLPEKYNDIGTSGLTATVTAAGPNEVTLELAK